MMTMSARSRASHLKVKLESASKYLRSCLSRHRKEVGPLVGLLFLGTHAVRVVRVDVRGAWQMRHRLAMTRVAIMNVCTNALEEILITPPGKDACGWPDTY